MSAKSQVKAVKRRLVGAGHMHVIEELHKRSQVRPRVLLDCLVLLRGDVEKLRDLNTKWHYRTQGVPNNLSFNAYVRYILRRERSPHSQNPYGRKS